ncbi:MAG: CAP domain-containing protein [Rhodobacteraceae bacterium]|nr:MAG: CAP domain-containing protein [Paracoccaceae bacterium]
MARLVQAGAGSRTARANVRGSLPHFAASLRPDSEIVTMLSRHLLFSLCLAPLTAAHALACTMPPQAELEIHLAAVNAERARAGRAALVLDPALSQIAQAHACDMARRGYLSHTSPDGRSMMGRARQAGLSGYCTMGENIAQGQSDVPTAMGSWLRSDGHRRNILDRAFTHAGFGRAPGAYWVQLYAGAC